MHSISADKPSFIIQLSTFIISMECAVVLMVIVTILSPSLSMPSAGALSDFFPRDGMCSLSTEERLEVQRHIRNAVAIANAGGVSVPECGPGPWLMIADFDVSGAPPLCPTEWPLTTIPAGEGGCIRPSPAAGCTVATFPTGVEYGKVCGKIIATAIGDPNSFLVEGAANPTVTDGIRLVDGITITHSSPIQHIWTLSAAQSTDPQIVTCPCMANISPINTDAVNFAGGKYFCDTVYIWSYQTTLEW